METRNGTFVASLGYYSEDGTVKGTQYRRFSGTLNGNYKVLPILNIRAGLNFSTSESPQLYYDDMADLFERMQSIEPTCAPSWKTVRQTTDMEKEMVTRCIGWTN